MKYFQTVILGLAFSSPFVAESLPELGKASTVSGIPTTAQFFGGATSDNGASYSSAVNAEKPIDIVGLWQPEATHVNTVGNIYVVVQLEDSYYFQNEKGQFQEWNLDLSTLHPVRQAITFASTEQVEIIKDFALGLAGLSGKTFFIFLAYDTTSVPGDLFYSGTPVTISVTPLDTEQPSARSPNSSPSASISGGSRSISDSDGISGEAVSLTGIASDSDGSVSSTQWLIDGSVVATGTSATVSLADGVTVITFRVTDNDGATTDVTATITVEAASAVSNSMQIYTESISSQIVQARCVNCHGGVAALTLVRSNVDDYINKNYNSMKDYIKQGGSNRLLSKPQGINHGGGVQLQSGSTDLNNLESFIDAIVSE